MSTSMIMERLEKSNIDTERYITALFYVHNYYKHYKECVNRGGED